MAQKEPQGEHEQPDDNFTKVSVEDRRSKIPLRALNFFKQQVGSDRDARLRRLGLPGLLIIVRVHLVSHSSVR